MQELLEDYMSASLKLKGRVEEGRVVVWRWRAALIGLPVSGQDGGLVFTDAGYVAAKKGCFAVSTLGKHEEPAQFVVSGVVLQHLLQLL